MSSLSPAVLVGDKVTHVKNLGWLHRNLKYVTEVRLTPANGADGTDDFILRAYGRRYFGRLNAFSQQKPFEYQTGYASFEVFDTLEAPRLRRAGIKVVDRVRTFIQPRVETSDTCPCNGYRHEASCEASGY